MGLGQWHQAEGWRFRVTHAVQAEGDGSVGDNPSWAAPEIRITTYETDRVKRLRCMLPVEEGSQLVIGRGGTGTDLIVEDEHVSRVHLRFFVREGARLVEDMGSRWGTKLNGESLTDPKPLRHGDEIRLGKSTIHYICYWDILPEGPKNQAGPSAAVPQIPPPEVSPAAPPVPKPPVAEAKTVVPMARDNLPTKITAPDAKTKLTPPAPVPATAPVAVSEKKPVAKRNYLGFDVGGAILIVLLVLAGLVYLGYLIHKL
jgi:FHA domain-containing protein